MPTTGACWRAGRSEVPDELPLRAQGAARHHAHQAARGRATTTRPTSSRSPARSASGSGRCCSSSRRTSRRTPRGSRRSWPCSRPACRAAFEFRHASWFDDEVFEVLRARRRGAVHRRRRDEDDERRRPRSCRPRRLGLPAAAAATTTTRRTWRRWARADRGAALERGLRVLQARGRRHGAGARGPAHRAPSPLVAGVTGALDVGPMDGDRASGDDTARAETRDARRRAERSPFGGEQMTPRAGLPTLLACLAVLARPSPAAAQSAAASPDPLALVRSMGKPPVWKPFTGGYYGSTAAATRPATEAARTSASTRT